MNKEKWTKFCEKVQSSRNCSEDFLEINEVKPLDVDRADRKVVFVGQNPSYNREKSTKIFEYENVSDKVMNNFLEKLNLTRDDCYFTNLVKASSLNNNTPSYEALEHYTELFYEEIEIIKPLLIVFISKYSANAIDKSKLKCPIITLSHPSYYHRQIGNDAKAADLMYKDLVSSVVLMSLYPYNIHMDFINKSLKFKDEKIMKKFISNINKLKIANIDKDSYYNNVMIMMANHEMYKVQFSYYNYCWVECPDPLAEKYSLDNKPVKKLIYKYQKEIPFNKIVYEKDIHEDFRFIIDYYDYFEPIKKEELNYLTYDIETNQAVDVINVPGEIISIVYLLNGKYEFLMIDNNKGNFSELAKQEDVKIFDTEKEMLEYFAKIFSTCNIITGFNSSGFDNIYLLNRAKKLEMNENIFSPIYKVRNNIVEEKDRLNGDFLLKIHGLDLIDTMLYCKDKYFIYSLDKPSRYNLDYLGEFIKDKKTGKSIGRKVHDSRGPATLWNEDPQKLYDYNIQDVKLCRDIEDYIGLLNYLLSFKNLMSTFNIKWSLYNSKIIDFFILCNYSDKFVFPSKKEHLYEELEGAYVKTPISGKYNNVAVCDFKSLYPNLIRQFNISYETVSDLKDKFKDYTKIDVIDNENKYNNYIDKNKRGLMTEVVDKLMFMKDNISDQMQTSNDSTLPVKYNAIKAVINGIYGVSKYKWFRLYNINCARLITHLARTMTKKTEELADKTDYFLTIYGDTDSVFIHCNMHLEYKEMKEAFDNLILELNEKLSSFLEEKYNLENKYISLEFETLFHKLLMTQAKKKYYGLGYYIKGKEFEKLKEYGRGVDMIKKDTPVILRPILKELLITLVTVNDDLEIKDKIKNIKDEIYNLSYRDLLITKQISRELDEYKVLPQHVKAMLYSNKYLETKFNRSNYKGGLLHVIHPRTEVIMLEENMDLPIAYEVNYKKYFELFVKNKVTLFLDEFAKFFNENKTLDEFFK